MCNGGGGVKRYFPGIADEAFIRGDVPMTKQEVRIVALAKAKIANGDTVIDIGAGTGSLSVEAAFQAKEGRVFAIERDRNGVDLIGQNARRFERENITVIQGNAPEAMVGLPPADVIFVGGSGGKLPAILQRSDCQLRPGGRLVIMAVTVETLYGALHFLREKPNYTTEACGVQVTRIRSAGAANMFQTLNPVYIIAGTKGGDHEHTT